MKPVIMFTVADDKNRPYAEMLAKSLRKFYDAKTLPFRIYGNEDIAKFKDPAFFYRATPLIAKDLIKEYELVIKIDADSLITGNLDFILNSTGWDVGTVYNWNRTDPLTYGLVSVASLAPQEYYNCGFVAMRNADFINHWDRLCHSVHFDRLQYREQDILNLVCHYGNFKVKCFDDYDPVYNYSAWHGLRSKGEWNKIIVQNNELVLPKADDRYPERDKQIKVIHWAGGNGVKMNYKAFFTEEVIKYLDNLLK